MRLGSEIAGRYRVEAHASSGGMGSVYRAVDLVSGARVALKVLHEGEVLDAARFAREASLLAGLAHPGIVGFGGFGVTPDGAHWLAMEWLEGDTVRARLLREGLSPVDAVEIGAQVAEALAHAHARGVVHRDVKPENLMLAVGRVKLVDFGIARTAITGDALTGTGQLVGTPSYMAPEQARGDKQLDGRADAFALGCVLYECLAGRPAFAGENVAATLVKILVAEPASLEGVPGVPAELATLVATLLGKEPADRPRDLALVAAELRRLGPAVGSAVTRTSGVSTATLRLAAASVVIVLPSPEAPIEAAVGGVPELLVAARRAVAQVAPELAGAVHGLLDGTLVVDVQVRGGPPAAARAAAHAALALADLLPGAFVAIASPARAGDDAVDRAARLAAGALLDAAVAARAAAPRTIGLDETTAVLLGGAFEVVRKGDRRWLRAPLGGRPR